MTLDAVAEGDGLVVGGADGMPGEGNDGAVRVLAFHFGDHGGARFDGVLVVAGGEAEVLAKERGVFAGEVVGAVGPIGDGVWVVMLAGEDVAAGDGI